MLRARTVKRKSTCDLGVGRTRETESQDIWNETYPNLPKSLWWYRDRFDMGFRLVCDPINLPDAK